MHHIIVSRLQEDIQWADASNCNVPYAANNSCMLDQPYAEKLAENLAYSDISRLHSFAFAILTA